jgi:hypothetical protein
MKRMIVVFLAVFSMVFFVSCGESEETETVNDDTNETVDEEKNDDAKTDDVQEQHDEIADESENIVDDIETIDEIVEEVDENNIDSEQNDDETVDETEIADENNENPYSCLANPCAVDADCPCEASWCVIDDDNVSYAGLTKLTCAKKDCTVGDDSTCPADYTCAEIPGFVLALMPELPKTVCKKK